jgi:hypothetical protein
MADFTIKQGDTSPSLTDTLTYSDGTTVNLTGASVNIVVQQVSHGHFRYRPGHRFVHVHCR